MEAAATEAAAWEAAVKAAEALAAEAMEAEAMEEVATEAAAAEVAEWAAETEAACMSCSSKCTSGRTRNHAHSSLRSPTRRTIACDVHCTHAKLPDMSHSHR